MNILKRTFALMLCLALMVTCLAGCHEKGEIAVTIGDIEFTSGYYACVLFNADAEARTLVEEQLAEEEDVPDEIKYWNYKVEDTDYVKWVEKTALDNLKELAAVKTLCAENKITLDEETLATAKSTAESLWSDSGYSVIMEANGVGKETFIAYLQDSYLADEYFKHLYGEGGEKEIAADKVLKQLTDNYVLANKIEVSFADLSEEEIADKKTEFASYVKSLEEGTETFEEIYISYNGLSEEDHTHEEAEEGESVPQDYHASILGSEDTDYASDHFETAKAMETGEVKLVVLDDDEGLVLLVKKDIAEDPYYLEYFDSTLRHDIIGEDFNEDLAKYGEDLDCTVNDSSVKQFKVKKIEYPEA